MPHALTLSFEESELGFHLEQKVGQFVVADGQLDAVKAILGGVDAHDSVPNDGAADAILKVPGGEIQVKVALVEVP